MATTWNLLLYKYILGTTFEIQISRKSLFIVLSRLIFNLTTKGQVMTDYFHNEPIFETEFKSLENIHILYESKLKDLK